MKSLKGSFTFHLLIQFLKVIIIFLLSYLLFLLIFAVTGSLHTLKSIIPGYISPGHFYKFHLLNINILTIEYLPVLLFIGYYYWLMLNHKKILTSFMTHRGVSPIKYYFLIILLVTTFFFVFSFILRQNIIPIKGSEGYQNFKESLFQDIVDNPQAYIGKDLRKLGPYFISAEHIEKTEMGYDAKDINILSSRNQGGIKEVDLVIQCSNLRLNINSESIAVEDCTLFFSTFQILDAVNYIRSAVYNMDDLFSVANNQKNNIAIIRLLPVYMAKYIDYPNLAQYFCTKSIFWSLDNTFFYSAFFLLGIAALLLSYLIRQVPYSVQMLIITLGSFLAISVADILQIYSSGIDSIFHLRYAVPDLLAIFIALMFIITRYFRTPRSLYELFRTYSNK